VHRCEIRLRAIRKIVAIKRDLEKVFPNKGHGRFGLPTDGKNQRKTPMQRLI
jgi:hypothetical protein